MVPFDLYSRIKSQFVWTPPRIILERNKKRYRIGTNFCHDLRRCRIPATTAIRRERRPIQGTLAVPLWRHHGRPSDASTKESQSPGSHESGISFCEHHFPVFWEIFWELINSIIYFFPLLGWISMRVYNRKLFIQTNIWHLFIQVRL